MAGRSSCPECGTILRIRDRSFVGRRVSCPECKMALRVEATDPNGDYLTRRLSAAELAPAENGPSGTKVKRDKIALTTPPVRSQISKWINSPLTAAWLLAIAVVSLIAVLTLTPKFRLAAGRSSPSRVEPTAPVEPASVSKSTLENHDEIVVTPEIVQPPPKMGDELVSVSALEPVNVEGPLPWPPIAATNEKEPAVPAIPAPPKIDVESKMAQKLFSYKQSVPVRRRDLLEVLQEQLGAEIRYDAEDLGAADLDKTVTFELENTTIGGVIKSVADAAGWEIAIEATGLRLQRKQRRSLP